MRAWKLLFRSIALKSALLMSLVSLAACSQMIGLNYDTPCENEPLNTLRHRMNVEYQGVRMADTPVDVLAKEREILVSIAEDKAKFENLNPDEVEGYKEYWRTYMPDPFTNRAYYESIDMRMCALVSPAHESVRQRALQFKLR